MGVNPGNSISKNNPNGVGYLDFILLYLEIDITGIIMFT
jgi:hypothetical protein